MLTNEQKATLATQLGMKEDGAEMTIKANGCVISVRGVDGRYDSYVWSPGTSFGRSYVTADWSFMMAYLTGAVNLMRVMMS